MFLRGRRSQREILYTIGGCSTRQKALRLIGEGFSWLSSVSKRYIVNVYSGKPWESTHGPNQQYANSDDESYGQCHGGHESWCLHIFVVTELRSVGYHGGFHVFLCDEKYMISCHDEGYDNIVPYFQLPAAQVAQMSAAQRPCSMVP